MCTYTRSLRQTSVDSGRAWQNLAEVDQVSRIRQNSVKRRFYWNVCFSRICQNLIELAELGRTLLLSVLPRHFYCNWASPVTYTELKMPYTTKYFYLIIGTDREYY